MPTLLLIRGIPGTGKTTLAKTIKDTNGIPYFHVEADMYFTQKDGSYQYDRSKINEAHTWCQKKAAEALEKGLNVVVSNTFCQDWEIEPYILMAKVLGIPYEIISLKKEYGSIHNLPKDVMQRFRNRFKESCYES